MFTQWGHFGVVHDRIVIFQSQYGVDQQNVWNSEALVATDQSGRANMKHG